MNFPTNDIRGSNVAIKTWIPIDQIEPQALEQLKNVASLPCVVHHVAVMPDVHFGKGATVGSVIVTKDAISPACVGVDIGCGMSAVKTNLAASDLPDNLKSLRNQIERDIPVGFNWHNNLNHYNRISDGLVCELRELLIELYCSGNFSNNEKNKIEKQLGTLGGGNHFIELCLDENQAVWLMLHSGSRNIGKTLADVHIKIAKELEHNRNLPDPDLAYFLAGTKEIQAYRADLLWAQRYAMMNRKIMMRLYKNAIKRLFQDKKEVKFERPIDCHHNYVSEETHYGDDVYVTRKGAIYAGKGAMGICPGSMGTRSFITKGLGHPESFNSAAHGAGRAMSRGQARRSFNEQDFLRQTEGVECRKDKSVIDEIPKAYKDIEQVIANMSNLVSVEARLKQVMCIKG